MGLRDARGLRFPARRRVTVVALGLGALLLVGTCAGLTAAAWNDSSYFRSGSSSASVDLRASADGTTYVVADGDSTTTPVGTPVDLSAGLTNLLPGSTVVKTVYVWDAGSSNLSIAWSTAPTTVFGATCDTVTYSAFSQTQLTGDVNGGAASKATATVTIKVLDTAPTTCQNRTATLKVVVTGTTP